MASLPSGFVYLESIDPRILQEIRYAGFHNMMGRPLKGYEASRCILSLPVAEALKKVQDRVEKEGYTLKVYEGYRPLRAGEDMVLWAQDLSEQSMKAEFYAHINKADVFKLGYISMRSGHTRGRSVDVTLVPYPVPHQPAYQPGDPLEDGIAPKEKRFSDNSIDMGTGFDCFHEWSHTDNPSIQREARKNRDWLRRLMQEQGFQNYPKEWWHYDLIDEPFPDTYFDFPIQ